MNTYINPIKNDGDFADPFVIKYNGKYYLYSTTPRIECWSSMDLLNWAHEGPVIDDKQFPGLVPFAPEVVYSNGTFYMYTSPSGRGHYVLSSKSPLGPFKIISDNLGHNIDGSVFIDDDDNWFFYWADEDGVMGCKMKSPCELGTPVNTGAYLNGWTEGPLVKKEKGLYYMTYTGNHYLSPGYRINGAVSESPLGPFRDVENNPIIVNTSADYYGLGHNCIVTGPDLSTKYIVYHNMNGDLRRFLNIDIIQMNEGQIIVDGPSKTANHVPKIPGIISYGCGDKKKPTWKVLCGRWEDRSDLSFSGEGDFRCTSNFCMPKNGAVEWNYKAWGKQYGISFGELKIEFNSEESSINVISDEITVYRYKLPKEFIHKELHCLLVRYSEEKLEIFLDGNNIGLKGTADIHGKKMDIFSFCGKIGVGYVAVSDFSTDLDKNYYPVPSIFHISRHIGIKHNRDEKVSLFVSAETISEDGNEAIVKLNGIQEEKKPVSFNSTCAEYEINLKEGFNDIIIDFGEGVVTPYVASITNITMKNKKGINNIEIKNETTKGIVDTASSANFVMQINWSQMQKENYGEIGVIFRASKLSLGGEGNDEQLGINFFIGYSLSVKNNALILAKHKYDKKELVKIENMNVLEILKITLAVNLDEITVFDSNNKIILSYKDRFPIMEGCIGYRAVESFVNNIELNFIE